MDGCLPKPSVDIRPLSRPKDQSCQLAALAGYLSFMWKLMSHLFFVELSIMEEKHNWRSYIQ